MEKDGLLWNLGRLILQNEEELAPLLSEKAKEVLEKLPEEEGLAYAGAIVRLARMRRLRRRPALHSGMLSASGLGFPVELLGETARYPRPQEAALLLLFLLLMLSPLLLRTLPGLFSASIAW